MNRQLSSRAMEELISGTGLSCQAIDSSCITYEQLHVSSAL